MVEGHGEPQLSMAAWKQQKYKQEKDKQDTISSNTLLAPKSQ